MKFDAVWVRRAGFGLLGIVLLAVFGYVVVRTGPFAPVRVTAVTVAEGSVAPSLFGIGIGMLVGVVLAVPILAVGAASWPRIRENYLRSGFYEGASQAESDAHGS